MKFPMRRFARRFCTEIHIPWNFMETHLHSRRKQHPKQIQRNHLVTTVLPGNSKRNVENHLDTVEKHLHNAAEDKVGSPLVQKFGSESGMHFQVCEKLVFSREKQNRNPPNLVKYQILPLWGANQLQKSKYRTFCQVWMSDRTSTHTLFPEQLVGANLRGGCIGFTRQKEL